LRGAAIAVLAAVISGCASAPAQVATAPEATRHSATIASHQMATPSPAWLRQMNQARTASGLGPIEDSAFLSSADLKHAEYLVKTHATFALGAKNHDEDESSPFYSAIGRAAGKTGDVIADADARLTDQEAIDGWLYAPFHALPILDPELKEAGFGRYCSTQSCAAVLNFGRGSSWSLNGAKPQSADGAPHHQFKQLSHFAGDTSTRIVFPRPVLFPPDGGASAHAAFRDGEWPLPYSGCAGYELPTGPIALASFGRDFAPTVSDSSFTVDGHAVDSCVVTAATYNTPDSEQLKAAKSGLEHFAAVFVIPREPVGKDSNCRVSISTDAGNAEWSFRIDPKSRVALDPR
jgi:uncharacterized protein YkwD